MTPLPAIILNGILKKDLAFFESHSILYVSTSLVFFILGFCMVRQVNFYLRDKEKKYGIFNNR